METPMTREKELIARVERIIDPEAFEGDHDNMSPTERSIFEHKRSFRRKNARKKARTILAMFLAPKSGWDADKELIERLVYWNREALSSHFGSVRPDLADVLLDAAIKIATLSAIPAPAVGVAGEAQRQNIREIISMRFEGLEGVDDPMYEAARLVDELRNHGYEIVSASPMPPAAGGGIGTLADAMVRSKANLDVQLDQTILDQIGVTKDSMAADVLRAYLAALQSTPAQVAEDMVRAERMIEEIERNLAAGKSYRIQAHECACIMRALLRHLRIGKEA